MMVMIMVVVAVVTMFEADIAAYSSGASGGEN